MLLGTPVVFAGGETYAEPGLAVLQSQSTGLC